MAIQYILEIIGTFAFIAAIMGMVTAVMGGVIRDTLINETPPVRFHLSLPRFSRSESCL